MELIGEAWLSDWSCSYISAVAAIDVYVDGDDQTVCWREGPPQALSPGQSLPFQFSSFSCQDYILTDPLTQFAATLPLLQGCKLSQRRQSGGILNSLGRVLLVVLLLFFLLGWTTSLSARLFANAIFFPSPFCDFSAQQKGTNVDRISECVHVMEIDPGENREKFGYFHPLTVLTPWKLMKNDLILLQISLQPLRAWP